jgi:hypothetical protein
MAYDRQALVFRINGHFGATATAQSDHWSTGLRFAPVSVQGIQRTDWTTFLESAAAVVQAFHQAADVAAGTNTYIDYLTCAPVGPDGKYLSKITQTSRRDWTTPLAGAGNGVHPWNSAFVTSLRTANQRGYASNGRMYYPAVSLFVQPTTGRLNAAGQTAYLAAAKTLINGLNTAANTAEAGLRLHVMSKVGSGTSAVVTALRCDQRLDSIERRENDLDPIYATTTIP